MIASKFLGVLVLFFHICSSDFVPFILGGTNAKIEQFAHSVYLLIQCTEPAICSGSILTQNIVLTAAHCLELCYSQLKVDAYGGSSNIEEMTVSHPFKNMLIHRKYSSRTVAYDIALGSTDPWPLGNTIKRVFITRNFPGVKMARTAGWGLIDEMTNELSPNMKMIVQIIQSDTTCSELIKSRKGAMCATNSKTRQPTRGDSGSALVSSSGQQIGLVSFKMPNHPQFVMYTNVSYFYDWIKLQAENLRCMEDIGKY